jgi:hypothetical protein
MYRAPPAGGMTRALGVRCDGRCGSRAGQDWSYIVERTGAGTPFLPNMPPFNLRPAIAFAD